MNLAWILAPVYVIGWFVTGKVFSASDEKLSASDRAGIGFLALFWPAIAAVAVLACLVMLPTVRWAQVSRAGKSAGWAVAKMAGITRGVKE